MTVAIISYDFFVDDVDNYFVFQSKLDFFYNTVMLWLFCASTYFLWHSTNRSIVVDLIAYGILSTLLNFYIFYRSVDMLFISKSVRKDSHQQPKIHMLENVFYYTTCAQMSFAAIFTVLGLSILPAIYEDIKDNIFLALGGNTSLWVNFYNLTLSKSIIKLDLIFNLQFWTAFFFIIYDFREDTFYLRVLFWGINAAVLLLSILASLIGYITVKRIRASTFCLFFTTRILSEVIKIFIAVQFWRKQTILFQDLSIVKKEDEGSKEELRLREYVTGDCAVTFIMFIVCLLRMHKLYKERHFQNPMSYKNAYEKKTYFERESEDNSDINKSEL